MTAQEAVQKWKELKIENADFEFNCGGDSMNDTSLVFYGKGKETINSQELNDYFDNQIYNEVEFYVNSDGYYQGEFGNVTIELNDESENTEEHDFTYSKSSQAEYNERISKVIDVKLNTQQIDFIVKNISNINGGSENGITINYKRDFIMTDEDEKIIEEIETLLDDEAVSCKFEIEGEQGEWYAYSTNGGGKIEELTIIEGCLKLEVDAEYITYQESDW